MLGASKPLDFPNLIDFSTARGFNLYRLSLALANQRTRDWRRHRNASRECVGLRFAHDPPYIVLARVFFDQRHRSDRCTLPIWPEPTISCSHPFSKTNFASSFDRICDVP